MHECIIAPEYQCAELCLNYVRMLITVTDTTLYMFHTVNGCIMRVYWFYSFLSFSVVRSSSFFLAFITVAVVCVMDLVVWNKRGLDWIGLRLTCRLRVSHMTLM